MRASDLIDLMKIQDTLIPPWSRVNGIKSDCSSKFVRTTWTTPIVANEEMQHKNQMGMNHWMTRIVQPPKHCKPSNHSHAIFQVFENHRKMFRKARSVPSWLLAQVFECYHLARCYARCWGSLICGGNNKIFVFPLPELLPMLICFSMACIQRERGQ